MVITIVIEPIWLRLKDLKLKISKGTGYRPPSLYEGNNLANGVDKLSPEETSNSELVLIIKVLQFLDYLGHTLKVELKIKLIMSGLLEDIYKVLEKLKLTDMR